MKMQGHILRVKDLGHDGFWRALHGAAHDAQEDQSLHHRHVSLLLAAAESSPAATLETSLLCHRAVSRMGGSLHSTELPPALLSSLSLTAQGPLHSACADLCLTHGLPQNALDVLAASCTIPLLNMGNAWSHPGAALADLALLQQHGPMLDNMRIAWVGGINGLAHSLMEAAIYAPIELFMAVPAWGEPQHDITALALKAGAKIFLTREPHLALDGAHFVYAGTGPVAQNGNTLEAGMPLTADMLTHARPEVKVLTGQSLGCGCRVDEHIISEEIERQRPLFRLRTVRALLHSALA